MVVEIFQLTHEISSFPEVLYKSGLLKNLSKFINKHKMQSSGGVLSMDVLKNFAKFAERNLCRSLFFKKVASYRLEVVRSIQQRCCVKKGDFKNFANFHWKTPVLESVFNKVAVLRASNFIKKRLTYRCFPVKFAKFLRTNILKSICKQVLQNCI